MEDLVALYAGKQFKVSYTQAAFAEFMKADAQQRARCQKWMRFYCDDGHSLLDKGKLRNEGKFHTGGPTGVMISIWAFKAWQLRAYGGVVDGTHFIITEIDRAKKQDEADQKALARAATKLTPFLVNK